MQTIRDLAALRAARAALGGRVALVPTMGALHRGHMRLVAEAHARADHVIASIFVNPIQFGPSEDLARYPRREAEDADMLAAAETAILWLPGVDAMYPRGFSTAVTVGAIGSRWCGAARPGHFDGVATVVAKLFNQIRPEVALFGEKDWQQLAVIRRMAQDLDLAVDIVGVPTVRAADGLALSSRNAYLSTAERAAAATLPQAMAHIADAIMRGTPAAAALDAGRAAIVAAGFRLDYLALVDGDLEPAEPPAATRLLAAAWLGTTRLIDNMPIKSA